MWIIQSSVHALRSVNYDDIYFNICITLLYSLQLKSFYSSLRLLSFRVRTDIGYLSHLCGRGEGLGVDGWFTGGFVQLIVHCCPSTGHREDVVVTVGDCRRWQLQVPPFLSSRGGRGSWGATRISGPVTIANIFFVVFLDHWPTMRGETLFSSTTSGNCLF